MTNKNETISFRIREEQFEALKTVADEQGFSPSAVFRDYVDAFTAHRGQVEVVPVGSVRDEATTVSDEFPQTIAVPTTLLRKHERVELECEHLREQLNDYKQFASKLERERRAKDSMDVVRLEDVDFEAGTSVKVD